MKKNNLKNQILSAFPQQKECLQNVDFDQFDIYDCSTEKRCFIKQEPTDPIHFTVYNPDKKPIHFLAVDNCLLLSSDPKRCDFIIFDEVIFCFIEIKDSIKPRQRSKRRKKAIEQLKSAIVFFKDKLELADYQLKAYICLANKNKIDEIRKTAHLKKRNTALQHHRVFFEKNFNVQLIENDEVTF